MRKYKYYKDYRYKGQRIQAYGNTREELKCSMERKERIIDEGKTSETDALRFQEYSQYCLRTYKQNASAYTIKTTRSIMNRINDYIGGIYIQNISVQNCQHILNDMRGMSSSYITKTEQAIRFVFRCACREGIITSNPASDLVIPQGTRNHHRPLTPEEREAVINLASRPRYIGKSAMLDRRFYAFLLMLLCGCRPQEAAECKGSDIVTIKGSHLLHIRGTKTRLSDRFVPIPKDLYTLIKKVPQNEYLAPMQSGAKQVKDKLRRTWKNFLYYLNIEMGAVTYRNAIIETVVADDLTPYCFRHEYCTECARRGVDIRTAQKLMGHASIRMTADIYTALGIDDLIDSARAMFN